MGIVRGGNCTGGELSGVGIVRLGIVGGGNCPWWELSGWELSGWELSANRNYNHLFQMCRTTSSYNCFSISMFCETIYMSLSVSDSCFIYRVALCAGKIDKFTYPMSQINFGPIYKIMLDIFLV